MGEASGKTARKTARGFAKIASTGLRAGHRAGVWPLVSGMEMRALDRLTIDERGLAGEILMESAGRALVHAVLRLREDAPVARARAEAGAPIRVFCGAGNNGGDGFVLVRHLLAEGFATEAILVGDPGRLPRDAAANWHRLEAIDAPRRVVDPDVFDAPGPDPVGARATEAVRDRAGDDEWDDLLDETCVVVDALFGTGLQREIVGGYAGLINAIAAARQRGLAVLSVDIPSGIAAATGRILGTAVAADRTVTISLPKVGLALEPGRSHAGEIEVARIGIADPDPERLPRVELWNERAVAHLFPARPRAGYKGSFGHVLVVAGSTGLSGAAALCARASLRAGAGLVTLVHPQGLSGELSGLCAEVMTASAAATTTGGFARTAEKGIEELAASRDVLAIGPGLGRDPETIDLVRRLVVATDHPIVIDADGLFAMQGQLALLHERKAPTVLTPHPGEAARLLEADTTRLMTDRLDSARRLAEATRSIVVLKGAGTVVADPSGRALIIPTGGPALASGGTGDTLTGIVAALLATELPAFEAAGLAAWWHGAAADRTQQARVGFGLLASELADALPGCAADILERQARRGGRMEGEPDEFLDLRFPGR
jgi:NAD(P)H-hydrate epimerase